MGQTDRQQLTQLLDAVARADDSARGRLFELVYGELRVMAAAQMAREAGSRTLQPTALVHEAYLRLFAAGDNHFANRRHFFAAAAKSMRRILVDDARKRERKKRGGRGGEKRGQGAEEPRDRGGGESRGTGEQESRRNTPPRPGPPLRTGRGLASGDNAAGGDAEPGELIDLDAALGELERREPQLAEVVQLRYFAGLSIDQTAELIGVAPRTVDNRWRIARAWLHRAMTT